MNYSISIDKVLNGWTVRRSWDEKEPDGSTEYKSEEWVFLTLDEVFEKVKELLNLIK